MAGIQFIRAHAPPLDLPVPRPDRRTIYSRKRVIIKAKLLTETIANANDLLISSKDGEQPKTLMAWDRSVIKRFHDQGIYHSDLNCHKHHDYQDDKVCLLILIKCEQRPHDEKWESSPNIDRLKSLLDKEDKLHTQFDIFWYHQWRNFWKATVAKKTTTLDKKASPTF